MSTLEVKDGGHRDVLAMPINSVITRVLLMIVVVDDDDKLR